MSEKLRVSAARRMGKKARLARSSDRPHRFRRATAAAAIFGTLSAGAGARAETNVFMPDVIELSGPGAVSGTNWRDGVILAVDEINASGGILGRQVTTQHMDTQSNPGVSRAQVQKALDGDPYVVLGPIYSGSVKVDMALTRKAEVPEIVGGEAAELTQTGNPWIFRTAFGQQTSMPKIANYLVDNLKVKSVAILWVNNDFGKGGRDSFLKEMKARDIKVVADLPAEQGQADFAADVNRLKSVSADAVFVYYNEEEDARFLIEAKRQGLKGPFIGETTLLSQKVIELAGAASNGVRGHVGLTIDAPIPAITAFATKFENRFKYRPDHNGIKGYTAVYLVKYVTEKNGGFDRKMFADKLHGLTLDPKDAPGILMEATWNAAGDVDRASFLAEIDGGKQKVVDILPKLGK